MAKQIPLNKQTGQTKGVHETFLSNSCLVFAQNSVFFLKYKHSSVWLLQLMYL